MAEKITDSLLKQMRDEFVFGYLDNAEKRVFPSIDMLVKRHNVPRATLYRYSAKNGWQTEKNRVQSEIEQQLDAQRIEKLVNDGKKLDDNCLTIAQSMLGSVGRKLQNAYNAEQQDANSTIQGVLLRELSQVAINAQKLGKLALGQAQEISKVSADVSNPEAFRAVMEQLDEIAEARSRQVSEPVH